MSSNTLPELELYAFDGPESAILFRKNEAVLDPKHKWWEISCPKKLLFTAGCLQSLFVIHIPCSAGVHGRGSRYIHLIEFKEPITSLELSEVTTYGTFGWPGSGTSFKYFADLVKRANYLRSTGMLVCFDNLPGVGKKRAAKEVEVDLTSEEVQNEPPVKRRGVHFVPGTPEHEVEVVPVVSIDLVPEIQLAQDDPEDAEIPSDDDVSHVTTHADLSEDFDFLA